MGNRINRQLQNKFLAWATSKGKKATPLAYQLWVATDPAAQALSTQSGDMGGNGVLKGFPVIGLSTDAAAVQLDKLPLNLSNQGAVQPAQPASPSPYQGKGIFGLDINQRIKNYVTGQN